MGYPSTDANEGAALSAGDRRVVRHRAADREFVTRRIADETIIVPVVSGVGDLDAIFTLNAVGARIWGLIEAPMAVDAIVAHLVEEFDVTRQEAARDLAEFLDKLTAAGLIVDEDPAAP